MFFFGKNKKSSSENSNAVKVVEHIAADETFEHDGLVEVTGDIGEGAEIIIKNGGLLVRGNVGDDVHINVSTGAISMRNVVIVTTSNGSSDVAYDSANNKGNITILGNCGNGLELDATFDIRLNTAGDNLIAKARHGFTANSIGNAAEISSGFDSEIKRCGDDAQIDAKHNIKSGSFGERCELSSGFDTEVTDLGAGSSIKAKHGIEAHNVAANCHLKSGFDAEVNKLGEHGVAEIGHNFTADHIGQHCNVKAGFDITAKEAFNNAVLKTSFTPEVETYLEPEDKKNSPRDHNIL